MTDERLGDLETRIETIATVCAAVADDMLRACFVLEELSRVGLLPNPLPWKLATVLVELQHAIKAKEDGDRTESGEPIEARVQDLYNEVAVLRADLAKNKHG